MLFGFALFAARADSGISYKYVLMLKRVLLPIRLTYSDLKREALLENSFSCFVVGNIKPFLLYSRTYFSILWTSFYYVWYYCQYHRFYVPTTETQSYKPHRCFLKKKKKTLIIYFERTFLYYGLNDTLIHNIFKTMLNFI